MSSSGLIYAVIVGAWAAYLVPMWLRRQDELNEARPTERFSTAIRLLSGRAGMERRYAKDLQARSPEEGESRGDPDGATGSVDVRSFAAPPSRQEARPEARADVRAEVPHEERAEPPAEERVRPKSPERHGQQGQQGQQAQHGQQGQSVSGRRVSPAEAAARARRSKVLARRRRTTVMLFLAFTLGAIVAAVGGLAFLWAPAAPALLLSAYIVYLRGQERRRFTYTMDRRRAEVAAQRLRERERQPRRRVSTTEPVAADEAEEGPAPETETGLSALAADRRALVEQTDHAEWVDQQRERQRGPGRGDSWDPVPVPLPTYVTAPVAPRATGSVDLGAPDAWSSARSSTVEPTAAADAAAAASAAEQRKAGEAGGAGGAGSAGSAEGGDADSADGASGGRSDARRAASARRARERGRTPLFDQYADGDRPRAANE
ncbi:gephyrin-like molybdotransferase receptor GlpR [Streptomyces sp. NPDC059009]|uniref:divisome protein SepX/GlpR n=1 Tax=Streptomyces sp. NPDC059009 TaxID=3346694 RepID=UPI0036AB1958